ncbi:MAG: PA0069 family radical SAM protein [Rubricoccaceae bacterium]|nr:PA0069 family radical SAM protein [Rubricoccaceae bacterium]
MNTSVPLQRRGRGAAENPANRFDRLRAEIDPGELDEDEHRNIKTEYFRDTTRKILSENDSPDIPFRFGLNPYRGCEHGCIYCYARPTHEYLGFSAGLDFESKIVVKYDAPYLLSETFQKPSWKPEMIALSGNTDCYQPIERKLEITRGCLEVFLKHRNPAGIITKNALITRDIDILKEMSAYNIVRTVISVTSLRDEITGKMEPRTSRPTARLKAIEKLATAGIPVGVNVAPIIPGLTDEEIPEILKAAAEHGAQSAGYTVVRFPGAVEQLFPAWLKRTFPDRADKVLNRIRSLRGGKLVENRFHKRMQMEGEWGDITRQVFRNARAKYGLNRHHPPVSTEYFRHLTSGQMDLF